MDLTTLESVKASPWLAEAVDSSWNEDWDPMISYLITARSNDAELFCNRQFQKLQRVEYHDGGGQFLFLRSRPVYSLVDLKWSLFYDWAENYLEISPLAPMAGFNAETGQVILIGGIDWYSGVKTIQVTYIGGYDLLGTPPSSPPFGTYTPLPADIEGAICQQVAYDFRRRKDLGLLSITMVDGSIQKKSVDKFLPDVLEVLKRYRNRYVG